MLNMSENEIELILKSCKAYGRFALHKEASKAGHPGFTDMKKTVTMLLMGCNEQGITLVNGTVNAVLGAMWSILKMSVFNNIKAHDMPLALLELWDNDKRSVFSSLSAVLACGML